MNDAGGEKPFDRDQAVQRVLSILRNPLALMSIPTRQEAYELAHWFEITAADLLEAAVKRTRRA